MGKLKIKAQVVRQECIGTGIYSLVLKAEPIAEQAVAGQFVSVYSSDGSKLLPRPISLCDIDKEKGTLRLVYRVVGAGTKKFSQLAAGEYVDILGPPWKWFHTGKEEGDTYRWRNRNTSYVRACQGT